MPIGSSTDLAAKGLLIYRHQLLNWANTNLNPANVRKLLVGSQYKGDRPDNPINIEHYSGLIPKCVVGGTIENRIVNAINQLASDIRHPISKKRETFPFHFWLLLEFLFHSAVAIGKDARDEHPIVKLPVSISNCDTIFSVLFWALLTGYTSTVELSMAINDKKVPNSRQYGMRGWLKNTLLGIEMLSRFLSNNLTATGVAPGYYNMKSSKVLIDLSDILVSKLEQWTISNFEEVRSWKIHYLMMANGCIYPPSFTRTIIKTNNTYLDYSDYDTSDNGQFKPCINSVVRELDNLLIPRNPERLKDPFSWQGGIIKGVLTLTSKVVTAGATNCATETIWLSELKCYKKSQLTHTSISYRSTIVKTMVQSYLMAVMIAIRSFKMSVINMWRFHHTGVVCEDRNGPTDNGVVSVSMDSAIIHFNPQYILPIDSFTNVPLVMVKPYIAETNTPKNIFLVSWIDFTIWLACPLVFLNDEPEIQLAIVQLRTRWTKQTKNTASDKLNEWNTISAFITVPQKNLDCFSSEHSPDLPLVYHPFQIIVWTLLHGQQNRSAPFRLIESIVLSMTDINRPIINGDTLPPGLINLYLKPLIDYGYRRFICNDISRTNCHQINGLWWDVRRSNIFITESNSAESSDTKNYQMRFQQYIHRFVDVIKQFISPTFEEMITNEMPSQLCHSYISSFIHSVRLAICLYMATSNCKIQDGICHFGANHCAGYNGQKVRKYVRRCYIGSSAFKGYVSIDSEHLGNWKTPWKLLNVEILAVPHILMAMLLPQLCTYCSVSSQVASWVSSSVLNIKDGIEGGVLIINQFCKMMTLAQMELKSLEMNQVTSGLAQYIAINFALGDVNQSYTSAVRHLLWPSSPPLSTLTTGEQLDEPYSALPPLDIDIQL